MEEQRASFADLLARNPGLRAPDLAGDLERVLNHAVQQVDPATTVRVTLESDWVAITPSIPPTDAARRRATIAALYTAKETWFEQWLGEAAHSASD